MKTKSLTPFQLIIYAALIAAVLVFCAGLTACTKTEVIEKTIVKEQKQDLYFWDKRFTFETFWFAYKYEADLSNPEDSVFVYVAFFAEKPADMPVQVWTTDNRMINFQHRETYITKRPPKDGEIPSK